MSYEYMSGLAGHLLSDEEMQHLAERHPGVSMDSPAIQEAIAMLRASPPIPPPSPPSRPLRWYGSFLDCTDRGGTTSWKDVNDFSSQGYCVQKPGEFRSVTKPPPPGASVDEYPILEEMSQAKYCCYPSSYVQQKEAEHAAKMAVYQKQDAAYKSSPAYKAWKEKQRIFSENRERAGVFLGKGKISAASIGDPCAPPKGGIVGSYTANVPRDPAEREKLQAGAEALLDAGCEVSGHMLDMNTMELCCPPGVQELPTSPETEVTNGNGALAPVPTYFGLTPFQLGVGALGAVAFYFLVLKK